MLIDLFKANRSYRKFKQNDAVSSETLKDLVELTRFSACGHNRQTLRYKLINTPDETDLIFNSIKNWKTLIPSWAEPALGERPPAYILILHDRNLGKSLKIDVGIAAQSITIGATEKGLNCCMLGGFDKRNLTSLEIPTNYTIELIIAIGKANEIVHVEDIEENDSTNYWLDDNGVHYVPKHTLEDLIL